MDSGSAGEGLEKFCTMQLVSYLANWMDNYIALRTAEKQNI
jgi:hypothetical protein